jgi:hypothetical protein
MDLIGKSLPQKPHNLSLTNLYFPDKPDKTQSATYFFKAITREQVFDSEFKQKSGPHPCLYFPRYKSVLGHAPQATIKADDPTGHERVVEKYKQRTHICPKAVKQLNYPINHKESKAVYLANRNKKMLLQKLYA